MSQYLVPYIFFYLPTNKFIGAYTWLWKTWANTLLLYHHCILTILQKRVLKKAIGETKRKSQIVVILNKYKDILNNIIDSSNVESLKRPKSESISIGARPDLEKDHLVKDRRGLKDEKNRWKGKKKRVIREDNSFEVSVYY